MKKSRKSNTQNLMGETNCSACGGSSFKEKTTTFPLNLPSGKTMNVARVQVQECVECGELIPTYDGKLKLARCIEAFYALPG